MSHENLWAPWRLPYLQQMGAELNETASRGSPEGSGGRPAGPCFLCDAMNVRPGSEEAKRRLVLLRDDRGVMLLNRFPYSNGHLMVAPADHLADLPELTAAQRAGLMELTALAERLLQAAINAQGFNVGINLGRCAGAGVPGHLHVHIVPRWHGDTNFMQTVGQIRVIPQALEESYEHLSTVLVKVLGERSSQGANRAE